MLSDNELAKYLDDIIQFIFKYEDISTFALKRRFDMDSIDAYSALRILEEAFVISGLGVDGLQHILCSDADSAISLKNQYMSKQEATYPEESVFDFPLEINPKETIRRQYERLGYVSYVSNGLITKILVNTCIYELIETISKSVGDTILNLELSDISDVLNYSNFSKESLDTALANVINKTLKLSAPDFQKIYRKVIEFHNNDGELDFISCVPAKVAATSLGFMSINLILKEFMAGKWSLSRGWPDIECFNGDEFHLVKVLYKDERAKGWDIKTLNRLHDFGIPCQIIRLN